MDWQGQIVIKRLEEALGHRGEEQGEGSESHEARHGVNSIHAKEC